MGETHVLMYGNKYCRFASYSSVTLVDDPVKASLYTRLYDANYKTRDDWHSPNGLVRGASLQVKKIRLVLA